MPKPLPIGMRSDLFKLEQGALLELWEIDLRHISSNADPDVKGEIYRFHNGVSQTKENIWWQGKKQTVLRLADKGQAIVQRLQYQTSTAL